MDLYPVSAAQTAALDRAIAITGVGRYRYLATEHPDPEIRAGYLDLVVRIAAEGQLPATPVPVSYGDPSPGPCGGCP